jgi:hypothetical protein
VIVLADRVEINELVFYMLVLSFPKLTKQIINGLQYSSKFFVMILSLPFSRDMRFTQRRFRYYYVS